MTMKNVGIILWLGLWLCVAGCYTTMRHPLVAEDAENPSEALDQQTDASCLSCHRSYPSAASIPAMKINDYRWHYYYDSAWWRDDVRGLAGDERAPMPADFRQRYPNENRDTGVGAVASPTYVTPSLGKKAGDAAPSSTVDQDPRREFDRRGESKKSEKESRKPVERRSNKE